MTKPEGVTSSEITSLPISTMETHLYLVRHGETDFNRQGIVQGRGVDAPLNVMGRKQATALAERAVEFDIDIIYASTLLRAKQTAQTVAKMNQHAPLVFLRDLEEMSWGSYEGLEVTDELRLEFKNLRDAWGSGNHRSSIAGGESALDVRERGLSALRYILKKHEGERVLVVAHGRFLRILIASILTAYGLNRMEEIKHANTGVNYIIHSANGFKMEFLNSTDHLISLNALKT